MSTLPAGKQSKDKDKIKLTCEPAPGAAATRRCSSQRHLRPHPAPDLQPELRGERLPRFADARRRAMLLEAGASYGNLVNDVARTTPRPRPPAGSASTRRSQRDTSFMFHKLNGRPARRVVRRAHAARARQARPVPDRHHELWIEAGAPRPAGCPEPTDGGSREEDQHGSEPGAILTTRKRGICCGAPGSGPLPKDVERIQAIDARRGGRPRCSTSSPRSSSRAGEDIDDIHNKWVKFMLKMKRRCRRSWCSSGTTTSRPGSRRSRTPS